MALASMRPPAGGEFPHRSTAPRTRLAGRSVRRIDPVAWNTDGDRGYVVRRSRRLTWSLLTRVERDRHSSLQRVIAAGDIRGSFGTRRNSTGVREGASSPLPNCRGVRQRSGQATVSHLPREQVVTAIAEACSNEQKWSRPSIRTEQSLSSGELESA
jgi:hypothetical protein